MTATVPPEAVREDATDLIERALLGALLVDRDAVAAVAERLRPPAFASATYRVIYEAILALWTKRTPADPALVAAEVTRLAPELRLGLGDVLALTDAVPSAAGTYHAPYYADLIVEFARARAVAAAGARLVAAAHADPTLDPAEAVQTALRCLEDFGATAVDGPVPYRDLVPDYQERLLRQRAGERPDDRTPTGFRRLDGVLRGGFWPGDLVLIGARPGMGKTAFALQLAHNAARSRRRVLFFSAEMDADALLDRAAAEFGNVSPRLIDENTLPNERFSAFLTATDRLALLPVEIDDTSGITTEQMLVRTQRAQGLGPIGLVVFDYLELAGDAVRSESEERRVAEIGRRLKHLARTCRVPVLALCQLSRKVEERGKKIPSLADLRYSGALEAHADKVLFLYRHDYYVHLGLEQADTSKKGVAEIIVAKHRNGPTDVVTLRFAAETMSFRDWEDV